MHSRAFAHAKVALFLAIAATFTASGCAPAKPYQRFAQTVGDYVAVAMQSGEALQGLLSRAAGGSLEPSDLVTALEAEKAKLNRAHGKVEKEMFPEGFAGVRVEADLSHGLLIDGIDEMIACLRKRPCTDLESATDKIRFGVESAERTLSRMYDVVMTVEQT